MTATETVRPAMPKIRTIWLTPYRKSLLTIPFSQSNFQKKNTMYVFNYPFFFFFFHCYVFNCHSMSFQTNESNLNY